LRVYDGKKAFETYKVTNDLMTRTHDIDLDELFNTIQLQGATIRELEKKVAMQDERIAEASLKANQVG